MKEATIGRWGNSLAVRLAVSISKSMGLHAGERVEIVPLGRDIALRRGSASEEHASVLAAEEIEREALSYKLDDAEILEMLRERKTA